MSSETSGTLSYTPEWNDLVKNVFGGNAPLFLGTGEQLKGAADGFTAAFITPILSKFSETVDTSEGHYKAGDGSSQRCRKYQPRQNTFEDAVVIFFHGGGYVCGSIDLDAYDASTIAEAGVTCISFDYRLAPEHAFPAAHDDAWAAYQWSEYKDRRIVLAGSSAGVTLAASVAAQARDGKDAQVVGQLLMCPPLAPPGKLPGAGLSASYKRAEDAHIVNRACMENFNKLYNPQGLENSRLFPLLAESFAGLPKTALLAPELDPNFDENGAYAAELQKEAIAVRFHVDHGLPHAHWLANFTGQAGQAHAKWVGEQTEWLLGA